MAKVTKKKKASGDASKIMKTARIRVVEAIKQGFLDMERVSPDPDKWISQPVANFVEKLEHAYDAFTGVNGDFALRDAAYKKTVK